MSGKHFCHQTLLLIVSIAALMLSQNVRAQITDTSFFPDGTYDSTIPPPEEVLGFPIGERPSRYEETVRYITTLAESSPRVRLFESGKTYENRTLYYLMIGSEDNISRLDTISEAMAKLADPRIITSDSQVEALIDETPGIAWMMYSIHGDEFSGVDSALQLAYQLAAGTDPLTEKIRRELVVGIDPMENPDGRERFLAQMQQWQGRVSSSDGQSIQHTGVSPWGRTNHYLFDLNRDWFILEHPESRARVKVLRKWHPQVVVDAHEMGSYDTYLFNPPREPINSNIHSSILEWWKTFSVDQAQAFDRYGWSYYTREWHEDWYPGYGTSFPSVLGAVGILYEQAQTDGSSIKRPDGTLLTFRDAVHHQFISSLANITTAADNSKALLRNYYTIKKESVIPPKKGEIQAYYIDPGKNPTRARRLVERLLLHGIEIDVTNEAVSMKKLRSFRDKEPSAKTLPAGTYVIHLEQPLKLLINAILEFDPRLTTAFLQTEREHVEKGKGTRLYEASAWSMLLSYDVDAYVSTETPPEQTTQLNGVTEPKGKTVNRRPGYGYIIDYRDDNAIDALISLFEKGYAVRLAMKPFRIDGHDFSRGSLLVRVHENPSSLIDDIGDVAQTAHVHIYGIDTALAQVGPDLGGREFRLLTAPKIAVLTGPSISSYSFGTIWFLLDYELECHHSILNYNYLSSFDLRKYNVLVMPSAGIESYRRILGDSGLKKIKDWVAGGGTLISTGNGSAYLADSTTAFSKVNLRRQALTELPLYKKAVDWEKSAGKTVVDSLELWEGAAPEGKEKDKNPDKDEEAETAEKKLTKEEIAELDERQRLFLPRGAILRVDLDEEHWLNFGAGSEVPAIIYSPYAFLSKKPVQTAARLSEAPLLRLSGLLWPEARTRWEKTAYVTREAHGKGQVILFAGEPDFRSYFYGTSRLLINAMLLGPGLGTQQVIEW